MVTVTLVMTLLGALAITFGPAACADDPACRAEHPELQAPGSP